MPASIRLELVRGPDGVYYHFHPEVEFLFIKGGIGRRPLPLLVETGMDFVRKHAMCAMEVQGARRVDRWNVPVAAVREALLNAVVHAGYSLTGTPQRLCIFDTRLVVETRWAEALQRIASRCSESPQAC